MTAAHTNMASVNSLLDGFVSATGMYGADALNSASVAASGVCLDSRLLVAGDVYLAMAGASSHGMQFVEAAMSKGAVAIVVDDAGLRDYSTQLSALHAAGTPVLHVPKLKQQAGAIAARFYQHPSKSLQVVAVTGTDGKTSVCRFVANALNGSGKPCGYIGTLGWGMDSLAETDLTTPDAVTLQRMMASLRDDGAAVVALEASSHGLDEGRLNAVNIDVAVLTNFGRDHLDYHKNLDAYKNAKAQMFSWPSIRFVVLNGQDELGRELAEKTQCQQVLYFASDLNAVNTLSKKPDICLQADVVELHSKGLRFELLDNDVRFRQSSCLIGSFNVDNLLACHGVLRALGHAANDASASLDHVTSVPGRIELFSGPNKPTAIVDFAHTPQALTAVIKAVRTHCEGELWVVFGCGGDRDPGKRGPMGAAAELADHIVVTDDNPRTEQSQLILDQIVAGMKKPDRATVIADRASAIAHALKQAQQNDLVLVAGKGHEDYQIVGTEKRDFSDRNTVQRFMQEAV